ncbi:MAG: hypothetical protein R3C56_23545 [Pirellulaceae bacterium]
MELSQDPIYGRPLASAPNHVGFLLLFDYVRSDRISRPAHAERCHGNDSALSLMISVGAGLGSLSGWALGMFVFRSWPLAGMGMVGGLCLGCVAGALTLISSKHFLEVNLIACGGAWLMIVCMCLSARVKAAQ